MDMRRHNIEFFITSKEYDGKWHFLKRRRAWIIQLLIDRTSSNKKLLINVSLVKLFLNSIYNLLMYDI